MQTIKQTILVAHGKGRSPALLNKELVKKLGCPDYSEKKTGKGKKKRSLSPGPERIQRLNKGEQKGSKREPPKKPG